MPDANTDAAIERIREADTALDSGKHQDNEEWGKKAMRQQPDAPESADETAPENELGKE